MQMNSMYRHHRGSSGMLSCTTMPTRQAKKVPKANATPISVMANRALHWVGDHSSSSASATGIIDPTPTPVKNLATEKETMSEATADREPKTQNSTAIPSKVFLLPKMSARIPPQRFPVSKPAKIADKQRKSSQSSANKRTLQALLLPMAAKVISPKPHSWVSGFLSMEITVISIPSAMTRSARMKNSRN
eukprot:762929-Hanusia_phi.AAC.4